MGGHVEKKYWSFSLFYVIGLVFALILDSFISLTDSFGEGGLVYGLFVLASLCPSLAVSVRRLHDIGRSGWYLLVGLVPLIGPLFLIFWCLSDSQPETNKWGADPKGGPSVVQNIKY